MATKTTKPIKKPTVKKVPLLVTTSHRGVFFGYGVRTAKSEIELIRARNCISWTASIRGVFGLAVTGPNNSCRIGPAVPVMTLRDVVSCTETTAEAAAAWEKQPWG